MTHNDEIESRHDSRCGVAGCPRPYRAKGLCHTHYEHQRRRGVAVYVPLTDLERWERFVVKSKGCWEWTGSGTPKGYGVFAYGGRQGYAHRFSYETFGGPISEGLQIDHLCRNPGCVNPQHLDAVTPRVNTLRGISPSAKQAAQTHCKRGHPLNGANLYLWNRQRHCRTCRADRTRQRREAA